MMGEDMMGDDWTPGPWSWETESAEWPDSALIGGDGDAVLWWDFARGFQFGKPANARLIAAAPDMIEALRKCENFIANTESEFGITLECGEAARAAIAKAEGRS